MSLRLRAALSGLAVTLFLAPPAGAVARFCTRTDVPLGANGPYAVVAADLYGADGIPDLAITFGVSRKLVLLRNDGTGNFTPTDTLLPPAAPDTAISSLVSDPAAIVAADFNGDGSLDLAGTNRSALRYFAYLNPGVPGSWGPEACPDARRGNGTDMIATNWDGDSALDLVIVTEAGAVGIALGAESGGMPTGQWGSLQRFTTTAQVGVFNDVDVANFINLPGDGLTRVPDVLASDNQYGQLVIWPGDVNFRGFVLGDPATLVRIPVTDAAGAALSPIESFVEDWNGDGFPDALVVTSEGVVLYFAGNGGSTVFNTPMRYDLAAAYGLSARLPTEWTSVSLVDIVGNDGIRDLVVADAGEPTAERGFNWLTIVPGLADAPATPSFDTDATHQAHYAMGNMAALKPGSVAVADFDGDTDYDVVVLHGDAAAMTLLRNDGSGRLDGAPSYAAGAAQPRAAGAGRLDGDLQDEVVVACLSPADPAGRTAFVFRGLGPDQLAPPDALTPPGIDSPSAVTVASVNSADDNALDVLTTYAADQVLWRGNGNGTFRAPTQPGSAGTAVAGRLDLADLVGDTSLDAAVVERAPADRLRVFTGDGHGGFTLFRTVNGILSGQDVASGRFFGGTRPDILVSGVDFTSATGIYIVRWDDATSDYLAPQFLSCDTLGLTGVQFTFLEVADFKAGGTPEVLAVSPSGDAYMLEVSGGTLALDLTTAPITFGGEARAVVVNDLTGDGIPDVAVAERNVVRVREGRSDGSFDAVISLLANISTEGLAAADLDGDSRPELVAVSQRTNDLTVFCNNSVGSMLLRVGRPNARDDVSWLDQGPAATYGLVTGVINNLWQNRDLRDAICLASPAGMPYTDTRPLPAPVPPTNRGGYYYLAKCAGGDCSEPTFGFTSSGRPRFGAGSPGNVPDPCP